MHEIIDQTHGKQILQLDELLSELDRAHPRKAEVIRLRFFAGLCMREIARVLDISLPTVERDSRTALAWLSAAMNGN